MAGNPKKITVSVLKRTVLFHNAVKFSTDADGRGRRVDTDQAAV